MSDLKSTVTRPEHRRVLRAFGDEITVHLGGAETGGLYTMLTDITPPGSGPPPHSHEHEDEWFLVLEGEAEFLLEGTWTAVGPGGAVFFPRGSVHAFRNVGESPLKTVIQLAPSGFEIFFERCADEFAREDGPRMPKILEIGAEHGIHFVVGDDS